MLRSLLAGPFSRRLLTASLISATALPALADDIDIFTGKPLPGNEPNLLIVLDSSSNWNSTFGTAAEFTAAGCPAAPNTKFAAEMCVLKDVLAQFTTNVRIGLMMFAESGTGDTGGYVRYAIRDVGPDNATSIKNQTAFIDMLANFEPSASGTDNSSSSQPYGKTMFEAFKYFGGGTGATKDRTHFGTTAFAGWSSDVGGDRSARRRDYRGNNSGSPTSATANRAAQRYGADDNAAFADSGSKDYISPIKSACAKNFIIFISNGNPSVGGDGGGSASATQLLTNLGGNTAQITSGGVAVHASTFDEWARFLNNNDVNPDFDDEQKIITYTIAVYQPTGYRKSGGIAVKTKAECDAVCDPIASNTDQQMINLMRSGAAAGGGIYFDGSNIGALKQAIARMLNEVQAKNSVFVSASLPVSVNTQGTFLNQVYMGMFRPEATGNPRWLGNLKQYKIIQDPVTLNLNLADQNDQVAINPATGFVSPTAKSFWTVANDFWRNDPSGTPKVASDSPDGEIVEKGGAGERIRMTYGIDQTPRNRVYTCPPDPATCAPFAALSDKFDTSTIQGATFEGLFGVGTAELAALVRWIRGEDNKNGLPCDPLVAGCTWTSAEKGPGWDRTIRPSIHGDVLHSRPVVLNYKGLGPFIFYGANDGTLRGTKGGRADTDGLESWAFVAPEFYGRFKRQRDNSPVLKLPGTDMSITPTPLPKDYFFDGAIGSYQELDAAGATVRAYIYVTARRGGRVMYAFDVTSPTAPKFMWKKTNTSASPPDIGQLGQTWSEPKAFKVRALPSDPVIMFGAGYDPGEDKTPADTPTTMGQGVFVLNGRTGENVAFFPVPGSPVPSDVAVIDHDFDTLADRAYVGDLKGNIWRMDIDDADPGNWKMYHFAKLGDKRKFFFRPDVVISKTYDLVLIGSGDREKPLVGDSTDRFYMLKDDKTGKSGAGLTLLEESALVEAGVPMDEAAKGWYLKLRDGEKVINAPLSIGGVTFFSTNRPTPDPESCQPNLGEARAYAVDFLTGAAGTDRNGDGTKGTEDLSTVLKSGGLPPSPVGGVVQLDDGKLVDFIIGSGQGGSPISPERPVREIPRVRKKLYWNTNSDK